MKVLVTGGAGFIGGNFVHHMVNKYPDYQIVNLDLLTYAGNLETLKPVEDKPNYKFVKGDIADEAFIMDLFEKEKFDVVVNFAAESHVDRSIEDPGIFVQTNVMGTRVLLDASRKFGVKRYHQVSTDEVYGDLPLDRPDLFFHERIEFFHDDDVLHAFREFADKLFRQGIAHADLEDRGAGENLPDIFVEDAPGDEAVFAVAPVDGVARPFVAEGFQIQKPLLKHIMAFAGPRAHAVIFLHVAGERPHLLPIGCRFAQFDHGLGVRGTHGRADDHRRVEPLADGHGFAHEILAFLTVARLQHGELAELGVMAVVLFVL